MSAMCSAREFQTILEFAVGIADRGVPLSVVSLGIDEGRLLSESSRLQLEDQVENLTRRTDRVASTRHGVFEFLLLDCNRQGALIFADRILDGLSGWARQSDVRLRCGISYFSEGLEAADALVRAADTARLKATPDRDYIAIHGE